MTIGSLSERINGRFILLFLLQFIFVALLLFYNTWHQMGDECLRCHSDVKKMTELGYPHFVVTSEAVERESKHKNIRCQRCHLGDARTEDKDRAHKDMLKVLFVNPKGEALTRREIGIKGPLLPSGDDRIRAMLPKVVIHGEEVVHPEVRNILWHDRDKDSLNFLPSIAAKTCGARDCHPEELTQFKTTIMGTNMRQRTMRTWLEPYGPHNCGPSFADLPVRETLRDGAFDFKNTGDIQKEINLPFSHEQAKDKQRFCNVCHAGCLDCHYEPDKQKGIHNIVKRPSSESCGGYGRGTSICHPGAMQSRRGETYIGGDYSIPPGMEPDVHYKKEIHCIDCHHTGRRGMGDMVREAGCQDCHVEIEEAHAKSIHKNMDCATCHINELRGYQITIWGKGIVADKSNPFKKYSLYYGIQKPPILMKDQKGRWMPVKIMPHSLTNFSRDVAPSETIKYRWQKGQTRDAYYIIGTYNTPSNNRNLLWMELQQASHPYGKARDCESCHKGRQEMISQWEYMDYQGVDSPFQGGYRVLADSNGLRVIDLKNTTPINVSEGYSADDFASWIHFKDKWFVPGDFSIKSEKEKYRKYMSMSKEINREIQRIDRLIILRDKKTQSRYKTIKGIVLHNQDGGLDLLKGNQW